jgi:hypothetical protein
MFAPNCSRGITVRLATEALPQFLGYPFRDGSTQPINVVSVGSRFPILHGYVTPFRLLAHALEHLTSIRFRSTKVSDAATSLASQFMDRIYSATTENSNVAGDSSRKTQPHCVLTSLHARSFGTSPLKNDCSRCVLYQLSHSQHRTPPQDQKRPEK